MPGLTLASLEGRPSGGEKLIAPFTNLVRAFTQLTRQGIQALAAHETMHSISFAGLGKAAHMAGAGAVPKRLAREIGGAKDIVIIVSPSVAKQLEGVWRKYSSRPILRNFSFD